MSLSSFKSQVPWDVSSPTAQAVTEACDCADNTMFWGRTETKEDAGNSATLTLRT